MDPLLRRLRNMLQNLITYAAVDRPGTRYQVSGVGEHVRPAVDHLEPQGLHFRAPAGARGVALQPGGVPENVVLLNAQGTTPGDALEPGMGGLHYLGTYKVFLDEDGNVRLGASNASALAARADYVDARLDAIVTYINAHTHAETGGTTAAPEPPLGEQDTVACTKVKIV